MMVFVSFGALHFVTGKVTSKVPKTSFSEREFQQYEQETGLKRRHKLISHEQNDQYTFYALPYTQDVQKAVASLQLPEHKQVKIIDPKELVEKEIEDEKKYSFLLQELQALGREMPRGLLTALVKEEVLLFMNTTRGQHDTSIVLANYPQSTEEAIKFENDVSDLRYCVISENEISVEKGLAEDDVRKIKNVVGYFDTVNKVKRSTEALD